MEPREYVEIINEKLIQGSNSSNATAISKCMQIKKMNRHRHRSIIVGFWVKMKEKYQKMTELSSRKCSQNKMKTNEKKMNEIMVITSSLPPSMVDGVCNELGKCVQKIQYIYVQVKTIQKCGFCCWRYCCCYNIKPII